MQTCLVPFVVFLQLEKERFVCVTLCCFALTRLTRIEREEGSSCCFVLVLSQFLKLL